jgi:hypothetical protein
MPEPDWLKLRPHNPIQMARIKLPSWQGSIYFGLYKINKEDEIKEDAVEFFA